MTEDEAKKVHAAAQKSHPDWNLSINCQGDDCWVVQSKPVAGRTKEVLAFAKTVLDREVLGSEVALLVSQSRHTEQAR